MKKNHPLSNLAPRRRRGGMALISVLAVLLLLTLLVVAFMSRATSARASANLYHASVSSRALSDTAVNFVQAQINEATQKGLSGGQATYTWGSQPGAIRVFDSSGNLNSIYRLYSAAPVGGSTARIASGSSTQALAELQADLPNDANWTSYSAQWVDLNAATKDSLGKYHFPIIDPRDPGADPTANPTSVATLWQPASGTAPLKGFSIQAPGTVGTSVNPAPMPLRWLYVLKNGAMVSPDSPTTLSNSLTFTGSANPPTLANPIVGRIAFWTDDDSSKININTAAGDDVVRSPNQYAADSTFWATPSFSAPDDVKLATYQPVNGEIQRYAGHPSTVGLNTTLSTLMGLSTPLPYADFFSLTPRYGPGGSISGTVAIPDSGSNAAAITPPAGRLFTSVGEMLFARPSTTVTTRTASALAADSPDPNMGVERANFFLTAHSSSSELNLFGEPRVSIWPLTTSHNSYASNSVQTPIDQLISYDSTIPQTVGGPNLYYFQRTDPTSSITDCNIANNLNLFNYLDVLTTSPIPGFGGTFIDKYPGTPKSVNPKFTSTHQIISEIFDYVRTINMLDPTLTQTSGPGKAATTYGQNWGLTTAGVLSGNYRSGAGGFQVVPSANQGKGINGWYTQGIGSFPYPIEISIHFVAMGLGYQPALKDGGGNIIRPAQPEWPVPSEQYQDPNVAHDELGTTDTFVDEKPNTATAPAPSNGTGSPEFDAETKITTPLGPPPGAAYTTPPSGRPADWTTAMQAFVYVAFVNPALVESHNQPVFCYSITGLGGLSIKDSVAGQNIPLYFPGNTTGGASSAADEERAVVDNTDGAGFINGWIGDWSFGYIPWEGEVGNDNYGNNPSMLSPQQSIWGIANKVSVANIAGNTNPVSGRQFPFYSQLFCISGQQQDLYPSIVNDATTNPLQNPYGVTTPVIVKPNNIIPTTPYPASTGNPNPNGLFAFNGGVVTIKMYEANHDGQTLSTSNQVSSYAVTFPTAFFQLPTYKLPWQGPPGTWQAQSHVIGTLGNGTIDRWHNNLALTSGAYYYDTAIAPNDVVESMTLSPNWSDARDLAAYSNTSPKTFVQHPNYGSAIATQNQAHNLFADFNTTYVGNHDPNNWGRLVANAAYFATDLGSQQPDTSLPLSADLISYPIVPPQTNGPIGGGGVGVGAYTTTGVPGDWDNGVAFYPDGPWVNAPDEGALVTNEQQGGYSNSVAYFNTGNLSQKTGIASTFSPNREMPSPVMFGSLPTGIVYESDKVLPWQTLLFRPGAHAGGFSNAYHPGEANQPNPGDPADHMLLDLFWMPQAEPYPISQPFVTEGKINLNYEIQPFTYITRNTALRALLGSEKIAVMPDSLAEKYKIPATATSSNTVTTSDITGATGNMDVNGNSHLPVDVDQTLGLNPDTNADPHSPSSGTSPTSTAQTNNGSITNAWYDSQAKTTRFFRSESEICDIFLVPQGYDWQEFSGATFDSHSWYKIPSGDFALVGDNTRERPYANLYSRLTTKSNTYTVYYTGQSLKNSQAQTDAGQSTWNESTGSVTGEYRGSTIIERYLDSNETALPNELGNPGQLVSLEPYYKWRVLETRQFAP